MKVGDLVVWAEEYIGVIVSVIERGFDAPMRQLNVCWADGGSSPMFEDELELVNEHR